MREEILSVMKQAGELSLRYFGKLNDADVSFKSEADLVTLADRQVEECLRKGFASAFPGIGFMGEEGTRTGAQDRCFVVDPIDGTTGFVHGVPYYAISVALKNGPEIEAGAVYLPAFDHFYFAEKGKGATKNGAPIHVSDTDQLVNALGATGFACVRQRLEKNNMPIFAEVVPHIRGIRRFGSAAVDLCLVSEGVFDLYWEMHLQPWDYMAGWRILLEAGGNVTDFSGGNDVVSKRELVASNGKVHDALLALINRVG